MDAKTGSDTNPIQNKTQVQRKSERDLVVARSFDAPAHIIFDAWTKPELLMRWWAPKSTGMTLVSCVADVRTGGSYRFEISHPAAPQSMAFFGKYIEVIPDARLAWTNEESADGAVTTVTFEEKDGKTLLTMHELYPTKEALDTSCAGMEGGMTESFMQLDELLDDLD